MAFFEGGSPLGTSLGGLFFHENPIISDYEYDILFKELQQLESDYPNLICLDSPNQAARVSPIFANIANMPWLANKGMANLNHSMADATIETLISHELPVRKIVLSTLNDGVMGELMMHYILETIVAAEMLGVNAFDQPAVERIKITSSRKMGRVIK